MVLLAWVCAWDGVRGDYGAPAPRFIIRPAGPSRQHKWVGYGYSDYIPLRVPKPYIIPKWVPHLDPTYTAFWVPETPAPAKVHGSGHGHSHSRIKPAASVATPLGPLPGFGPPKGNSVVASGSHGGIYLSGPQIKEVPKAPPVGRQPPLYPALPVLKSPLPLANTSPRGVLNDPLATFAPAPLRVASFLKAAPHGPSAPVAVNPLSPQSSDHTFSHPKNEDILTKNAGLTSNSVAQDGGVAAVSTYTQL